MMMGILDLVAKDYFAKGSEILAIHTGGLQGNIGFNKRFGLNLPHNL
jgi:1-aminocyclopropane-1-carboxylate deaminase/D-cysteine desulfhydrase-like pyridoxal-dependent ACC family enzyme